LRMRSILATEVPPNFMTRRAMVVVCAFKAMCAGHHRASRRLRARIDTGGM
jgi:hypothetical protein